MGAIYLPGEVLMQITQPERQLQWHSNKFLKTLTFV